MDLYKNGINIFIVEDGIYNEMYILWNARRWSYNLLRIGDERLYNTNSWRNKEIIGAIPMDVLIENNLIETNHNSYASFFNAEIENLLKKNVLRTCFYYPRYDVLIRLHIIDENKHYKEIIIKNVIIGNKLDKLLNKKHNL
ncbi:MAG: hypothetical protein LBE13_04875 [Bacteroidales bacterium]|nr:hypothetical protein [Bacteroidales bacterium]